MWVVIFRANIKRLDQRYAELAAELREKALAEYRCREFAVVTEGDEEIALSYWESESDIALWQEDADHLVAQRYGREHWYRSFSVEVAEISRSYRG